MEENKKETIYIMPNPIIDEKETKIIDLYAKKYEKMISPGMVEGLLEGIAGKIKPVIPKKLLKQYNNMGKNITEAELYTSMMSVISDGFKIVEEHSAKYAINPGFIIKSINKVEPSITSIDELCLARSYNIRKILTQNNIFDLGVAFVEGAATGFFGFLGLPFNLVLSFFIYFRAVQSIAMYYGYNVKDDPSELAIASNVFMMAFSPTVDKGTGTLSEVIAKTLTMTKATVLKDSLRKNTLGIMAENGGIELIYVQIRALGHKAAKNALDKAGKKGLEKTIFADILQQLGKRLPKEVAKKSIPIVGSVIGAIFDTSYMNKVLNFAEVYYHKRFLIEKQERINEIINPDFKKEIAIDIDKFEEE